MKEIIEFYMETGNHERLKQIRYGYTMWLPIELIHPGDRELCEMIDEYFENSKEHEKSA